MRGARLSVRRLTGRWSLRGERRVVGRALGWAAPLCGLLFVLGLAVSPLLHEAQLTAGWRGTSQEATVWLQHPDVLSTGLSQGQPFGVVVVFGPQRLIPYTVRSNGTVLSHGTATQFGSKDTEVLTFRAADTGWLSISFQGIKVPLQVWVHP